MTRRRLVGGALALGGTAALGAGLGVGPARGAAETPRRGGTLVAAQEVDLLSLDPHKNSNFSALQGYDGIYESLTGYDEHTNVVPALAQRWEINNDGKTYTFHLRPNVKFHNGQPMTGDDVQYSIGRVLDPKTAAPLRSWFDAIKEIKVLDPLTVQLNLDAPYPELLSAFAALRASAIMPKGYADATNLTTNAVGTGPFKLVEYVPQDHIAYTRNPDYWDQPLPYLDGMTFKILSEEPARLAALHAGQIQYAELSAQGAAQLGTLPGLSVLKSPYAWLGCHEINVAQKPLNDARVRRALRMAVNTREIIQKAIFGAGLPSGPINTGFANWALDPRTLPFNTPDVDGAKRLLAEAGYPNGGFTIEIRCSPQYPEFVASTLVIQQALRALNVTVNVVQMEWGAFSAAITQAVQTDGREGGQVFATALTFRPGPDGYVYPFFSSKGSYNIGGYANPALDRLMDEARSITNADQRRSLYVEIQQALLQDSPYWWWYAKDNIEALSTKFHGYQQSFTGRRIFLKRTWMAA
jgi:peptide/nickel transport system substrate-binding protein